MSEITKLSVTGYKSLLQKCSLDIRNLTIVSGANSSGKSSVMQPLLLLKQTLESQYDPGALLLDGPNVRITNMDQFFSKTSRNKKPKESFSVEIEIEKKTSLELVFKKEKRIYISEMIYRPSNSSREVYREGLTHAEIKNFLPKELKDFTDRFKEKDSEEDPKWIINRDRCFYYMVIERAKNEILDLQLSPAGIFRSEIESIIHIPGLRGNPERNYVATDISDNFPGLFQNYVASIINEWQEKKSNKLKLLNEALRRLNLTSNVVSKTISDTQVDIRVGRFINPKKSINDTVSIADVGLGVSQVLPVIVSLLVAKPGQIVYIEQPEIHLHPNAQAELGYFLIRAAKNGVKIIIETHSSILIRSIQGIIASQEIELEPDSVILHWFSKNRLGNTKIFTSSLDENGSVDEWPSDFDSTYLKFEKKYLDAVESNLFNNA